MTQEEKSLLLKDLCARLLYGIKCKDQYGEYIDVNIYNAHLEHLVDQISSGIVQMVLRPMSSMTEEEDKKRIELGIWINTIKGNKVTAIDKNVDEALEWLNAHHFDYRGLIEKGLALEAPKEMYKI